LWCSDKLVLSCFFDLKLESFAAVIPNHPQSSQIIAFHRKSSREKKEKRILDEKIDLIMSLEMEGTIQFRFFLNPISER
jgi:hypothetical protein